MIPDPIDVITSTVAGWSWDQVANGIARWILGAIAELLDGEVLGVQIGVPGR